MRKTAHQAVPKERLNVPENDPFKIFTDPIEAEITDDIQLLRGTFAKSICRTNRLGTDKEREACLYGVPCDKLCTCLEQADRTIRYLKLRKSKTSF